MNKQAVLDVLNDLPVFESQGGEDPYILIELTDEAVSKLESAGISREMAERYGDDETFCILALAFSEGYANRFLNGRLAYKDYPDYYGDDDIEAYDLLVENGLGDTLAEEVIASNNETEIKAIMKFLEFYGHYLHDKN